MAKRGRNATLDNFKDFIYLKWANLNRSLSHKPTRSKSVTVKEKLPQAKPDAVRI